LGLYTARMGLRKRRKSFILKRNKNKRMDKRCEDGFSSCNPGADLFYDQRGSGTCHHPVSEKTQDGTNRESGGRAVSSEKSRYANDGRDHFSDRGGCDSPFLCKGLSVGDSGPVSDPGLRYHRIS